MDGSPNESGLYELSCDSIDVVFELVNIYCKPAKSEFAAGTLGELLEQEEEDTNAYPIISSIM